MWATSTNPSPRLEVKAIYGVLTMRERLAHIARSLKGRLSIASILLLPFFIVLTASLITQAFEKSQRNADIERLRSMIYSLLSSAEVSDQAVVMPTIIADPRFNDSLSGNFGFLTDHQGNILWRSNSARLLPDDIIDYSQGEWVPGDSIFFQTDERALDLKLNGLSFDVTWSFDENNFSKLRFIVLADRVPLITELKTFRRLLWQWLGAIGVVLIILQLIILRWGLKPLETVNRQLKKLKLGKTDKLKGDFPAEIAPVVDNFNQVLKHQQDQQEGFRYSLDNLAHSLKTPLAAISSQLQTHQANPQIITEHVQRMEDIIERQLRQAASFQTALTYQKIALEPIVRKLIETFEKVYYDKQIRFSAEIEDGLKVRCDESDLMELLGNLLDNACKYGNSKVSIAGSKKSQQCVIDISDNGSGVEISDASALLQRGARADTQQQGQGIGLSVSTEIIRRYKGNLQISQSQTLGGSCFTISLPY